MRRWIAAFLILLSLLAANSARPQTSDESKTNQSLLESESATGTIEVVVTPAVAQPTKGHVLVPDDLVEIKVYQQTDLETKARIEQDGTVTMPLLGPVKLSGKNVEQARALIRERLAKDYLVNPQVSVTVVEYAKRTFTILGEVLRPGTYEIPGEQPFSLLQAIALAGGYTRIGAPGKVVVQRIENGQKKVYNLDAGSMAKDERAKPFEVLPNDNITVGERMF